MEGETWGTDSRRLLYISLGHPMPELSSRLLLHGRKKTNWHGPAPAQRVLLSADLKYLAVSTKNCDEPTAHC